MVTRTDRTYVDAEGITIHFHVWQAPDPKGVVQLEHGLGEYAARNEPLAQAFAAAGYTVYADDHRGHGQTGLQQFNGDASRLGHLGPGGLRATIEALRQFTVLIRAETPGLRLALMGHSWGSLMAQKILNDHAADYDAAILTGTAYRTITGMNGGQLNARFKHTGTTGNEWLSRDVAVHHAFTDDPLTFYADVIKLFGVADGLRLYGTPSADFGKDIPLLIAIGSDDTLGGEKSVTRLAAAYRDRSKLTDVEVKIYPGARHEIFHEVNSDEVTSDIITWLDNHLALNNAR